MSHHRPTRWVLMLVVFILASITLIAIRDNLQPEIETVAPSPVLQRQDVNSESTIPLDGVLHTIGQAIMASISRFDPLSAHSALGISIPDPSPSTYLSDLESTFQTYFPASQSQLFETTLKYLHLITPPEFEFPIPKNVYTTDIKSPEEFPEQFKSWAEMNRDWQVRFVGDGKEGIDGWLEDVLGVGNGVAREMRWLRKKGIVRADLFRCVQPEGLHLLLMVHRYLVLLVHGGLYTDTDTACVLPIQKWAMNPEKRYPHPLAASLPFLLEMIPHGHSGLSNDTEYNVPLDIRPPPASLIVAIEIDAPETGNDWREESFVRGIQVAQWTIMARRGHPVLLDVLGRALRMATDIREREESGQVVEEPDVVSPSSIY
jgi:alpha 1,6-mannosyltransferase